MQRRTCAILGTICMACGVLTEVGCSEMPRTFRSIELGKPLDMSLLPKSTVVLEREGKGPRLSVVEYQRSILPVGFRGYSLEIFRDGRKNVLGVQYDEYVVSYWVLLVAGTWARWERNCDDLGAIREEKIESRPLVVVTPIENFPLFLLAVDQCFREPEAIRRAKADSLRPPMEARE